MALMYQKYLPKLIITDAMIEAFVDGDYDDASYICDLRPWEMSPTQCHTWEPAPGADTSGLPRPPMVGQLVEGDGA